MDRAARAFAGATHITLGGVSLRVSPRVVDHYAEIEQAILSSRPNPFHAARDGMQAFADKDGNVPELVRETLLRIAMEQVSKANFVSRREVSEWIGGTMSGHIFIMYLAVRDNDRAKYTLDYVKSLVMAEYESAMKAGGEAAQRKLKQQLEGAVDQASGGDDLGNSTGPVSATEPGPTK